MQVLKHLKRLIENMQRKISRKGEKRLTINFQKAIKDKIKLSIAFLRFIKESELGLKEFVYNNNLTLICNFYLENDFEIRDWEKIKLDINIVGENIEFEEKITIWDNIDDVIRKKINQLINNFRKTDKNTIKDFNKRFFIEINPI